MEAENDEEFEGFDTCEMTFVAVTEKVLEESDERGEKVVAVEGWCGRERDCARTSAERFSSHIIQCSIYFHLFSFSHLTFLAVISWLSRHK